MTAPTPEERADMRAHITSYVERLTIEQLLDALDAAEADRDEWKDNAITLRGLLDNHAHNDEAMNQAMRDLTVERDEALAEVERQHSERMWERARAEKAEAEVERMTRLAESRMVRIEALSHRIDRLTRIAAGHRARANTAKARAVDAEAEARRLRIVAQIHSACADDGAAIARVEALCDTESRDLHYDGLPVTVHLDYAGEWVRWSDVKAMIRAALDGTP